MRRCDKSRAEDKNEEEMGTGGKLRGELSPSDKFSRMRYFSWTLKGRETYERRTDLVHNNPKEGRPRQIGKKYQDAWIGSLIHRDS